MRANKITTVNDDKVQCSRGNFINEYIMYLAHLLERLSTRVHTHMALFTSHQISYALTLQRTTQRE